MSEPDNVGEETPVLRRCRMVSVAYRGRPAGGFAIVLWKSSIDRGDLRGMLGIRHPTRVLVRCPSSYTKL